MCGCGCWRQGGVHRASKCRRCVGEGGCMSLDIPRCVAPCVATPKNLVCADVHAHVHMCANARADVALIRTLTASPHSSCDVPCQKPLKTLHPNPLLARAANICCSQTAHKQVIGAEKRISAPRPGTASRCPTETIPRWLPTTGVQNGGANLESLSGAANDQDRYRSQPNHLFCTTAKQEPTYPTSAMGA